MSTELKKGQITYVRQHFRPSISGQQQKIMEQRCQAYCLAHFWVCVLPESVLAFESASRDCFLFWMNRVPTVHIIPSTLGFQCCLRPFRLARMLQARKAARSIPFCHPCSQQLRAAQQPASISAKLSHPGTDRSPSWQQQEKQTRRCVWHTHSWGKWKEGSSSKPAPS